MQGERIKQLFRQAVLPGKCLGMGIYCHRLGCPVGMVSASRVGVSQQKASGFPAGHHLKKDREHIWEGERPIHVLQYKVFLIIALLFLLLKIGQEVPTLGHGYYIRKCFTK